MNTKEQLYSQRVYFDPQWFFTRGGFDLCHPGINRPRNATDWGFYLELLTRVLTPNEDFLIRGSSIPANRYSICNYEFPQTVDPSYWLYPIQDVHRIFTQSTFNPEGLPPYLTDFYESVSAFRPNIDIYLDPRAYKQLSQLELPAHGSVLSQVYDNGVRIVRVKYSTPELGFGGLNFVDKSQITRERRHPISARAEASRATITYSPEKNRLSISTSRTDFHRLTQPEAINTEKLLSLSPVEQLLQIARLTRLNCRFPDTTVPRHPHALRLSRDMRDIIKSTLSALSPDILKCDTSGKSLFPQIASEFMVASLYHFPTVTEILLNSHPRLFPYFNREAASSHPSVIKEVDNLVNSTLSLEYPNYRHPIVNMAILIETLASPVAACYAEEFLGHITSRWFADEYTFEANWQMGDNVAACLTLPIVFSPTALKRN